MKKLTLIFSVLFLAIIFSSRSANAQTVNKIDAKVPFAFSFGSKTYAEGNYTLRITRNITGDAVITLGDQNGEALHRMVALSVPGTGENQWRLIFGGPNGQRALTNIASQEAAYQLRASNARESASTKNRDKTAGAKTKAKQS